MSIEVALIFFAHCLPMQIWAKQEAKSNFLKTLAIWPGATLGCRRRLEVAVAAAAAAAPTILWPLADCIQL